LANRTLTRQFAERQVDKTYVLLTDRPVSVAELVVRSRLIRAGARFLSSPRGQDAQTRFHLKTADFLLPGNQQLDQLSSHLRQKVAWGGKGGEGGRVSLIEAVPLTGRTHQIRAHAAESGFPILGDTLYGGTPWQRVCLHAEELTLRHPASGERIMFHAPCDFLADPSLALRLALFDPALTDAFRVIHGASDGWPGWYLDRLGDFWLSQSQQPLTEAQQDRLARRVAPESVRIPCQGGATASQCISAPRGVYHKILSRHVRDVPADAASPKLVSGLAASQRFAVRENGVVFELSFQEGYSVGLFLDQRENRRRLLTGHVGAGFALYGDAPATRQPEVLNLFAYTCGFSVCAALGGARTTSVDLSRGYLEWGRRHFGLNGLDTVGHEFLQGDAFDWLRRLAKRGRLFDVVLLDPPTFSQSKVSGVFRAEKDYGKLVAAALPVVRPGGVLFASTNAAQWPARQFLATLETALKAAGRRVTRQHYAPQPPDFPISRAEPAYLKTVWLRVA